MRDCWRHHKPPCRANFLAPMQQQSSNKQQILSCQKPQILSNKMMNLRLQVAGVRNGRHGRTELLQNKCLLMTFSIIHEEINEGLGICVRTFV
ncbi:hypothetical protein BDZ91DRAFT_719063 [Kalaharituber pfeilii]|nr:hypothetical protein BDZ91DRAFT_719063 [Kalaharituber pfeilii]